MASADSFEDGTVRQGQILEVNKKKAGFSDAGLATKTLPSSDLAGHRAGLRGY